MNMNNFKFLSINNITNGKSIVKVDARKSKAKGVLTNKIKNFFCYVIANSLSLNDLPTESLDRVIEHLNDKKINLEKAKEFIAVQTANRIVNLAENEKHEYVLKEKSEILKEASNKKVDELNKKIDKVDSSIERVEEEKNRRNSSLKLIEDEEINTIESLKAIETEEINTIEPLKAIEEKKVDAEIKEQMEEIQKEVQEIREAEEVKVEQITPKELSELEKAAIEYKMCLETLKQEYNEKFKATTEEIVLKYERAANKFNERIILDMEKDAKKAIFQANENTKKEQQEKQVIQNDLEEYKNHYNQTLQVVETKNNEISEKDQMIESLKAELASKEELIKVNLEKENEYKLEIEKRDIQIKDQESEIKNYKTTIKTLMSEGMNLNNSEVENVTIEGPVKTK